MRDTAVRRWQRTDIFEGVEIRISVLSSGELLLNGAPARLPTIQEALEKADATQDSVLYYREVSETEPPP